jgi:hypothetical protein
VTNKERLDAIKAHVAKAEADWSYALTHACKHGTPIACEEFRAAQSRLNELREVQAQADAEEWCERHNAKLASEASA